MSDADIHVLVGILAGLFTLYQAWLGRKAVDHTQKLDGLMEPRIRAGAETAIAADHAARDEKHTLKQP
jgi:hypothetical protein